jgi:hypothetical protein
VNDSRPRWTAAVLLGYAAISVAFCLPLFAKPTALGVHDWDQHLFYYAQVIKNVVEYRQAPFWSPWYCGGNVMWQNPQVALLSPVYPLTAVTGLALAMKLNIVLHYWIGLVGMHFLLTRALGLTFVPAVMYLASLFTLSGAHAMHLAVGHSVFLPSFYMPWTLFFFLRAVSAGSWRSALAAAATFALMIDNGGLHIVPMTILAIAVFGIALAVSVRSWRPLVIAVAIGIFGALYAAPKLVPVSLFVTSDRFWDSRDESNQRDWLPPEALVSVYTDATQAPQSPFMIREHRHAWVEYGNYIGAFGALLIASSILWRLVASIRRRPGSEAAAADAALRSIGLPLAVTALVFLALSAGDYGRFAPASLLQHVPLFSSFRLPSRYTIPFVLFGVASAAAALRALEGRIVWTRMRQLAATAVCAIAVLQLIVVNRAHFRTSFQAPPLEEGFRARASGQLDRDTFVNPYEGSAPMLRALMADRAVGWCYEALQLKRGADDHRPLLWTIGPSEVALTSFTPNRIGFAVVGGDAPTKVFLNQNYSSGWHSDAGLVQLDPQAGGRMYVQFAAGRTGRFAFWFVPPGLWWGVALLMVGLAASIPIWTRRAGVQSR